MAARRDRRNSDLTFSVAGYKAISDEVHVPIRPLTVIAGANSSGKSSFMQPFLLLKQTVDAAFQAGPLLLHGPNVRMTRWEQAVNRGKARGSAVGEFSFGFSESGRSVRNTYSWNATDGVQLAQTEYDLNGQRFALERGTDSGRVERAARALDSEGIIESFSRFGDDQAATLDFRVDERDGFYATSMEVHGQSKAVLFQLPIGVPGLSFSRMIVTMIHVPGLRGNPERSYYSSSTGSTLTGTIEPYVASLLDSWQRGGRRDSSRLNGVASDLEALGLTWKVTARRLDDVQLEILVGRLPHAQQGGANDLVNIADVGFGVSQILPVVVALRAAEKNQIVYIEQPEIHLHPRAQVAVAQVLVDAANRGVIVVVETHSSLVVRGIQTAIANSKIEPDDVSLNWFSRDAANGAARVSTAMIDRGGRFGDWPIDFDEVSEEADWEYLMAASAD